MMKKILVPGLLFAGLLALSSFGIALAHGDAVLTVSPAAVSPGGEITVTGSDMEAGEVFAITLENALSTVTLGEATATGDGDEAGFTITLSIPGDLAPGAYVVRAATDEGEAVTTDLTVTAGAGEAVFEELEASAEPMQIDRSKPSGQVVGIVLAALTSAGLGIWLVWKPD